MSLASLQTTDLANAGVKMPVLHPKQRTPLVGADGEEVWIKLRGKDSDAFIASERKARERNIENMKNQVDFSAAEADRIGAETLAACTVEWSANFPVGWVDGTDDDTPVPYSAAAAVKLFLNDGVSWLHEQADKFIANRANFLKA